ncbi:MAG: electron transfer flavoprotein subunit beta/FixA family protein [Ignavibacteria bacterium]|nr:electron transfer flavoprotein subunit beta/FixA family protein [Ignavibacteria bacterium]
MNILVGISRVPDTATKIFVGADGKSIDEKGVKFIINPYDEFALEEGLRLKEKYGGTVVTITVGPESSKEVIRSALAMGADKAVLIKSEGYFDSYFVAKNIANYARQFIPDIIFFGRQSVDYDSLMIPAMVSEFLELPLVTIVSKLTIDNNKVIAERDVVGGKEVIETSLPCVISAQKGLNEPRYPKLPDILKSKNKPIEEITPEQTPSMVEIIKMEIPLRSRKNKIVGDSDEEIAEIVRLLHEEAKII